MNAEKKDRSPTQELNGRISRLKELCRRAGLPPVSVSSRFAESVLLRALDEMGLYDLVWTLRGSIHGLMPCHRNSGPAEEIYVMEFWSLASGGLPTSQRVVAVVSRDTTRGLKMELVLPDELNVPPV